MSILSVFMSTDHFVCACVCTCVYMYVYMYICIMPNDKKMSSSSAYISTDNAIHMVKAYTVSGQFPLF
jgi:hypothetical protein